MPDLVDYIGLARSLLIYYGRPFRIRKLASFYGQFIRPGDLCFDVGAHVGTHIRAFRRLGARVVALEPQPMFYRFLQRAFRHDPQVSLQPAAAGAAPGWQLMQVSRRTPTVSTLSAGWVEQVSRYRSFRGVKWGRSIRVQVLTLNDLIGRHGRPSFCKIDVEGYELEVLQGLGQPVPILSFEYLPGAPGVLEACLERLDRLGEYRYNWTVAERMRLSRTAWLDPPSLISELAGLGPDSPSMDILARTTETLEASASNV